MSIPMDDKVEQADRVSRPSERLRCPGRPHRVLVRCDEHFEPCGTSFPNAALSSICWSEDEAPPAPVAAHGTLHERESSKPLCHRRLTESCAGLNTGIARCTRYRLGCQLRTSWMRSSVEIAHQSGSRSFSIEGAQSSIWCNKSIGISVGMIADVPQEGYQFRVLCTVRPILE